MSTSNTPKPKADELNSQCLKSYNQTAMCPNDSCRDVGITNVENKCNIVAILSAIFCGLCWNIYRILKFKDQNCWDATHRCNKCGQVIYEYKAC